MAKGDHLLVRREIGYTHHGIDLGDGTVAHYVGRLGEKVDAVIRRTPLAAFAKAGCVAVRRYRDCAPAETVIRRALSRMGESRYSIAFNNCEHFATWCKTAKNRSEQVKDVVWTGWNVTGTALTVGRGVGAVASSGAVVGMSGSGVMSGLATVGGAVGGGAVAGIVALGAAPATLSCVAMRQILADDPTASDEERTARTIGRTATVAGAVAGSASAVGAVSALGTVGGLGGAGIASGLAAIGGSVGGGMAAGVVITTAAPAVAAAALGYGAYRAYQWLTD